VWEFFKVFAGPIALIVASVAATRITYVIGSRQVRIAQAQKDIAEAQKAIAYDKLKHDLFEQRFEIYSAAKHLIEAILKASLSECGELILDAEIVRLQVKLGEARFFFAPDIRALCERIGKHVSMALVASRAFTGYSPERPERQQLQDQHTEAQVALAGIYDDLAKKFERDLGFEQLTKGL
jgi:hypothetical protein